MRSRRSIESRTADPTEESAATIHSGEVEGIEPFRFELAGRILEADSDTFGVGFLDTVDIVVIAG